MEIDKRYIWGGLVVLVAATFFFLVARPSFSGYLLFGDEGYYASRGEWINENMEIPRYFDVYPRDALARILFTDNPLPIFLTAFLFFAGESAVRLMNPLISVLTGLLAFVAAGRFYSKEAGVFSMVLFFAMPSVITYTILLYADALVALLMGSAVYIFSRYLDTSRRKYLYVAAVLAGFAALTKVTGFFPPAIFILMLLARQKPPKDLARDIINIAAIFAVLTIPWFGIHNFLVAGNPGQVPGVNVFGPFPDKEYLGPQPAPSVTDFKGAVGGGGTGEAFLSFGLLNFVDFAYGVWTFIFILVGFAFAFMRKEKHDTSLLFWAVPVALIILWQAKSGRSEDLARFMIPVAVPFAVAGGLAAERIYDHLKHTGSSYRLASHALMVAILVISFISVSEKAESLVETKEWGGADFKAACDWVAANTPADASLLSIWEGNTEYPCKRGVLWSQLNDVGDIVFAVNETAVETMRLHGIDYVVIQKFSVTLQPQWPNYPVSFIKFLDDSPQWFEKVFENNAAMVYKVKY